MLKLLVAVDGSEHTARTLDHLLQKLPDVVQSAEIHLLNVQPPLPGGGHVSAMLGHERVKQHHHDEGMAALQPAIQKLQAAGLKVVHHIVVGEPGPTIVEFARQKGFDQIVMGSHGMGASASLILGSVTLKVVQLATIPVLLVK